MDRCGKFRDPDEEPERPESIAHRAANGLGAAEVARLAARAVLSAPAVAADTPSSMRVQEALVDESTNDNRRRDAPGRKSG